MAQKIRKIQRAEVKAFLDECDQSKPIVPVILDDTGLPRGEKGRKYVRALFSSPKKMGARCVVSNKCKRFLKFAGEDEEIRRKVEFVNLYLADGIQNTTDEEKECTIYIVPDYSFGNQLFVSLFRVLLDTASKIIAWLIKKGGWLWSLLIAGGLKTIINILNQVPAVMEKIEDIEPIYDLIRFVQEKMSVTSWLVLAMCSFVIGAVLAADRVCAKAVGEQNDNVVFLVPHVGWVRSFFFAIRWMDLNKFYRKEGKVCKSCCITDNDKSLCTRDAVRPVKVFRFGRKEEDGYRFLLAVLEHYSSLDQERILKYNTEPQ